MEISYTPSSWTAHPARAARAWWPAYQ